ncbi:YtxH domain-containing protein [uncultured Brachyspira sp.]|uniref:YtxH domain-containing protein n=1 Tax=uncultured Brachyspira sp. TaxID=221953 RepID=UPI0025DD6145|nr:YtxH domain-containing protein [uncultured Brachyspira sp.]
MSKEVSGMFSFLLGLTAGVALGVLFAPKAGEETREDLKETVDNIKYKVDDMYHRGMLKTSEMVEKGKEKTSDFIEKRKKKSSEEAAE